ncbi:MULTISPECIES: hypothetical protein [unclassified Microbacterium]|uniref:hypothetical protein n=1 Tax=Microbacterium TaxID=33882 RepID=UPI003BA222DE
MTTADLLALDPEWVAWEEQYTWHLDQVPALLHTIRATVLPLAASQTDKVIVSGSKADTTSLPFRLDAVDEADDLWAALVEYALEVADTLTLDRPAVLRATWFTRGHVAGIRAATSADTARAHAWEIVGWLIGHAPVIVEHDTLQAGEDHLFQLIRKARARHHITRPRRARPRPCAVCGDVAVLVDWAEIPGGIGPAEPVGACQTCGQTYTWRKA